MLELVKQAKIGSIVPIYKEIDEEINAFDYFAKLSDYGRKKNSVFFEDDEKSFGSANPCLAVKGKNDDFEIKALNNLGKKFLSFIKKDFGFCDKAIYRKDKIYGKLTPARRAVSEQEKLKLKTHMDIIRAIAFKFKPTAKLFCGLFGMVSAAPDNREDALKDPEYIFYFLDNMFVVDHKAKKTYFVANALIVDNSREKAYNDCSKAISNYEKLMPKKAPKGKKPKKKELKLIYGASNEEFLGIMRSLRKEIADGSILYAAPSRTAATACNAEPFDVYAGIRSHGSSFYINDKDGISIGAGANAVLNVKGESEKTVEMMIAASAKLRGKAKDEIEKDLDNKFEALLKVDENETACSIMLLDALRNDAARVSLPGTRYVDKMLVVDKQTEFQSLVSSVKGVLKEELDALHVHMAALNPAVTNGVPKIKAAEMLNKLEKGKKGFSSVLYLNPNNDLQAIAIDSIRIKKDKAYFSVSSRVFHNSDDDEEIEASNKKAEKILDTFRFGGLK